MTTMVTGRKHGMVPSSLAQAHMRSLRCLVILLWDTDQASKEVNARSTSKAVEAWVAPFSLTHLPALPRIASVGPRMEVVDRSTSRHE